MTSLNWRKPLFERLRRNVTKADGCWLWTGSKDKDGYGTFRRREGGLYRAHRVSYELHHGAIPDGMIVCHRCDNPACVRPDHLWIGTHKENAEDRNEKGRHHPTGPHNPQRGEARHNARLTADAVRCIRSEAGTTSQHALAQRFGVSQCAIFNVLSGKTWRHIQ